MKMGFLEKMFNKSKKLYNQIISSGINNINQDFIDYICIYASENDKKDTVHFNSIIKKYENKFGVNRKIDNLHLSIRKKFPDLIKIDGNRNYILNLKKLRIYLNND